MRERKVFGLIGPIWLIVHLYSSPWSCGCWLMVLFLLGPSTLTYVHLWLWWLLLYGVYLPNGLLKTIGPCIVMVTLCFVKGPLTHLWFWTIYFMLDLWLSLYDFIINSLFYSLINKIFMILLIKTFGPFSLISCLRPFTL